MKKRDYADTFALAWRSFAPAGAPVPRSEYRFAAEHVGGTGRGVRKRLAAAGLKDYRFDFAWPDLSVPLAVEVDGGRWKPGGGRHSSDDDLGKMNQAATLGWRVMHYSPTMLADPERVVGEVCAVLGCG